MVELGFEKGWKYHSEILSTQHFLYVAALKITESLEWCYARDTGADLTGIC